MAFFALASGENANLSTSLMKASWGAAAGARLPTGSARLAALYARVPVSVEIWRQRGKRVKFIHRVDNFKAHLLIVDIH
ncbi:hypothetical protein [Comamonas sp.]|uniref:hypothetical protein n=1 Tax=Comamonas sp. TaxID=34028 RepID=UPI0012BEFC88|nr:hypothetical protein [Comamonas sp.]MPT11810.1 hypothetical protein [Comamonas sp.]